MGDLFPGAGYSHADLVLRAEKWLYAFGCNVVFREFVAYTPSGEIPDAIGWKSGFSILIECKASRSDFLADKKKLFRKYPEHGIGSSRLYMCPPDIIQPEDLPEGWGLLWVRGKTVERVVAPKGNTFHRSPLKHFQERSMQGEVALLVSAVRRLKIRGHLDEIYEPMPSTHRPVERSADWFMKGSGI